MKKILASLLTAVMLLSLWACTPANTGSTNNTTGGSNGGDTTAATDGDTTGQLMVGYGKADITPTKSVPLAGFGTTEKRMSTGFRSYMYQIAVAVTDPEGNTAIVIAADAASIGNDVAKSICESIQLETGVPADNVIISAVHQHSAPDMGNAKAPSGIAYKSEMFIPGAVKAAKAAKAAMENRAPATVQTATVETTNMNFVRHYIMEDGSYAGSNFGNMDQGFVKHAAEVDNDLQLIKFVRAGQTTLDGKEAKDIILANFQGHPIRGTSSSDTNLHADMPGIFRDELEAKLDCQAIYFSGASGNAEFWSHISSENKAADYKEHGKMLAKLAADVDTYTDVELTAVKATKVNFTAKCNHAEDHRFEEAQKLWNQYVLDGDKSPFKKNGFESQYHAAAIVNHYKLPASKSFDIFALSFGDVAFVGAPYEMFCASGMAVKEDSPFKMTIVTTNANGSNTYMPTMEAWDYGCYEQYNSNFVRGTAERLVEEFSGMLDDLYGQY